MSIEELVEKIHRDMLLELSSKFDKSTGSWAYDILKPPSYQLVDLDIKIDEVDKMRDIYNRTGDELDKFIAQFTPIRRREATAAKGNVTITGTPGADVLSGTIVASASHEYRVVKSAKLDADGKAIALVECTVKGSEGNAEIGLVDQYPITVQGLETVYNHEPITEGYDEENDETLRKRYFDFINLPATSGNVYHYLLWAGEIKGVGSARVHPLWDGDNTVKIVIIDSNGNPASEELVKEVQDYIDPIGEDLGDGFYSKWGRGYGEAPVGAFCTVVAANAVPVKIEADISLEIGYTIESVENEFKQQMLDRFSSIALDEDYRTVSLAKVGCILLNTEGVKDYDAATLKLNGKQENIILTEDDVAVFDEVVFNEV